MPQGGPALSNAFSDYLSTKWQKVQVAYGKTHPRMYPQVMRVQDMETNPYLAVKISGMGAMPVKPEGTQFVFDQPIPGGNFQVTASPFGMGYSVSREMWRDDLYGVMLDMPAQMTKATLYRQEVQAWTAFNNAFSVATGYDATALCSTSHTGLDGAVQSNRPSPDVLLSQTMIQAALLNFELLNDDRSIPEQIAPSRIIYHPTNRWLVREILGSSGKVQQANNDANALLPDEMIGIPSRFLIRTQDAFLCASREETDIIFMWADQPMPRNFDDPFTLDANFTMYQRFGIFVGEWRSVYGTSVGV